MAVGDSVFFEAGTGTDRIGVGAGDDDVCDVLVVEDVLVGVGDGGFVCTIDEEVVYAIVVDVDDGGFDGVIVVFGVAVSPESTGDGAVHKEY